MTNSPVSFLTSEKAGINSPFIKEFFDKMNPLFIHFLRLACSLQWSIIPVHSGYDTLHNSGYITIHSGLFAPHSSLFTVYSGRNILKAYELTVKIETGAFMNFRHLLLDRSGGYVENSAVGKIFPILPIVVTTTHQKGLFTVFSGRYCTL
ncbi:hypothetical protein XBFM1_410002 [Xenorhabdus bovienii str. feltiae Moldova]|uniref:Uncharacterized protein n=1 Tax=Xenorhabdus bovienii str. feltiae Moldova TaxID=1398200 RepID=A0A077NV79_XENBV|nr:hypothetical protein XBFM1_410002 [Xenorhabdus bovienii str. feltiae Moldova]